MTPLPGGMESQPWIWKHALDVIHDAKEWAEALARAEQDLESAQHSYDSAGEDASLDNEKNLKTAADNYYDAHNRHEEILKGLRCWWHEDADYIDPEEALEKEKEQDTVREFWRQVKRMEEGS